MSQDTDAAEKEHEPTQTKLDEARRKGDLPRSADLGTAAAYLGFLIAAFAFGPASLMQLGTLMTHPLGRAEWWAEAVFGTAGHASSGAVIVIPLLLGTATAIAPFVALPATLALLAYAAQRAIVFAPSRLEPKLNKISPLANFRQKFGRNGLFEFGKSTVKLLIYAALTGLFLSREMPRILGLAALAPGPVTAELGRLTLRLIVLVTLIALVLGMIDLLWQRAEHLRRNRMSRQDLKEEVKQSEGDPQLKQQRRQKAVSLALNQMLAEVPNADVVVVNPTHYAVALKWERTKGSAPTCVAKGTDEIAARIREAAQEAGVPIHSDPPTARALFAETEIGAQIAPDHSRAVAAAIRFADGLRKARRGR